MGSSDLIDQSLLDASFEEDGTVHRGKPPTLYKSWDGTSVGWHQKLLHNGNYRMDLTLTNGDIMKLFKIAFGSEITPRMISRYGLSLSPEVDKAALSRLKLSDLTLADLAAIVKPATELSEADGGESAQPPDAS